VHESARSPERPAGTVISSPGGWYDAGDYNKYIVNSAFAVYFMLMAYENCPSCFPDSASNIPESGNGKSDLIDEVRYNLDWMLTMQDPADGGIYHKLTSKKFSGMVMPNEDHAKRYVVQKSTAAALDFAAVSAYAARLLKDTDPDYASILLAAAKKAWQWAIDNPALAYRQPKDIHTGTYARRGDNLDDEWSWARVEMYLSSGEEAYLAGWKPKTKTAGVPNWANVVSLGWLPLINARETPESLRKVAQQHMMQTAETILAAAQQGYRVSIGGYHNKNVAGQAGSDWVWGSNSVAAVHSVVLIHAYRMTSDPRYLNVAVANLDYLLGRNPTGYSYLTGLGARHTMNPHSRPSTADGVVEPVPGLLAGGPHNDHQDRDVCDYDYTHKAPAKSYYDHVCSYATNEHAINWNAALVAAAYLTHFELENLRVK